MVGLTVLGWFDIFHFKSGCGYQNIDHCALWSQKYHMEEL